MIDHMDPGDRVQIPTVEGPRDLPTYATVVGPDPDNEGYTVVQTDFPVMGEYLHSIEDTDIELSETAARMPAGLPPSRDLADGLRGYEWIPPEIASQVPDLYATEDVATAQKVMWLHFYTPSMDWYIAEMTDGFGFGYADLGDAQNAEWGDVDLNEMRDLVIQIPGGALQIVERDLLWTPVAFELIEKQRR